MSARICEPGEGIRHFDLAGTAGTLKADHTTTGDAFVVAEWTLAPGSFAPPLHRHHEIAESLYVLAGRLDLHVGDDHQIAVAGTFVSIPAGVPHTMSVAGQEPVRMLMITSNPTRSLQMYELLAQLFAVGEPDPETAGPLLAQLDMEMLTPGGFLAAPRARRPVRARHRRSAATRIARTRPQKSMSGECSKADDPGTGRGRPAQPAHTPASCRCRETLSEPLSCQRPSVSLQRRPSVLPTGGHVFSPLVPIGSRQRAVDVELRP